MRSTTFFGLVAAALPAVHALAFGGPEPTGTNPDRALYGTSPRPTSGPSWAELRKRQSNRNPETCGWVDGDYSSALTCSAGRTCKVYKSANVNMAGCCDGSDNQNCGWSRQCIDYNAFAAGGCGTNCLTNSFILKCTNVNLPYCVTWTYPGDKISDFGCAATVESSIYTILARATDGVGGTTSISLPTISGNAVTGYNGATGGGSSSPTDAPSSSSSSSGTSSRAKLAIGAIIGIVVLVLFLLFAIIVGVIFFLKKKKKQQQLAANAQAVSAAQANRPQSQYQPAQPPMQQQQPMPPPMQGGFAPPMPPQSPAPPMGGYFPPPGQTEQKYGAQPNVHEYAMTPISNPPTPAPAYAQPYAAPAPPMPNQPSMQPYYHAPAEGAHEVDAGGVTSQPPRQVASPPPAQYQGPAGGAAEVNATSVPHAPNHSGPGPVYEMGQGR